VIPMEQQIVEQEIPLEATNANAARREAKRRWPKNDVKLTGYVDGECVYLSLVRNVTKGNVATATKGIPATRFTAKVV
jgi:hypothetical protein